MMPVRLFIVSIIVSFATSTSIFAAQSPCGSRALDILNAIMPDAIVSEETITSAAGESIALPDDTRIGADPYAMICRQWPAHPHLLLVAIPLIAERSQDETQGDLGLYVLAGDTLDVLGRLTIKDMMMEDAIRIDALAFDTALYRMAPGRDAFGLRLSQRGSSRVNPFAITTLWLFEHRNGEIFTVLDNVVVKASGGEWDGVCSGEFWSANSILAMTDDRENGVFGLRVKTRDETIMSAMRDGRCESEKGLEIDTTHTLTFDGAAYAGPEPLSRGW